MRLRALAKKFAYRSGALALEHAWRNRDVLTIAMFHRVLRPDSPEWPAADPTYRVSDAVFAQCLGFFKKHYRPVAIEQVASALAGGPPLPDFALLVTFDDGWADNLEVALPLLRRAGVPAVVFVVPEAIEGEAVEPWWQETVFKARREGRLSDERIFALGRRCGHENLPMAASGAELVFTLLRRLQALSSRDRNALLAELETGPPKGMRQMMNCAQVRELAAAGIAVGAHGLTHLPLTFVERPEAELDNAIHRLESLLGTGYPSARTMSFPHGRYSNAIVEMARKSGYCVQCTSDPHLNRTRAGRPVSDLLGRISIISDAITDETGRFHPELLATWLFRRPVGADA